MGYSSAIKTAIIFSITLFFAIGLVVWERYPLGVKEYKTIQLGIQAAEGAGTSTGWAPPDDIIPRANFYVYALGDESMCLGSSCGPGGYFVECLGGWLSGYKKVGEEFDYGLRDAGVELDSKTVITIAGKDARVVGIYPGARIRNLPSILHNHRDLFSKEDFRYCSDIMPNRWK